MRKVNVLVGKIPKSWRGKNIENSNWIGEAIKGVQSKNDKAGGLIK